MEFLFCSAYNAFVKSVLLFGVETWTMLKSVNVVFLGYADMISSLMPKWLAVRIKRTSPHKSRNDGWRPPVFGYVRQLPNSVLAYTALHLAIDARSGSRFDGSPQWKRPRGRPRYT